MKNSIIIMVPTVIAVVLGVDKLFLLSYSQVLTILFMGFVVVSSLLVLFMGSGREVGVGGARDIWFLSVPVIVTTIFFSGVLASNDVGSVDVWKWVVISLGGIGSLGSLGAIVKELLD